MQARLVGSALQRNGYDVEYRWIKSAGDIDQRSPLTSFGEGIFVNTINDELLKRNIDIAVHSAKDLPGTYSGNIEIVYVSQRGDPRDTLVAREGINELASGSRIGTSSSRRRMQLQDIRSDLTLSEVRGNIETRISKIGISFDGIVMAKVALDRLKISAENHPLSVGEMVPAPNQGFIVAMGRKGDLPGIIDSDSDSIEVFSLERFCMNSLGFGCSQPLGILVERDGTGFQLTIRHYNEIGIRDIDDRVKFSDQDDLKIILSDYRRSL